MHNALFSEFRLLICEQVSELISTNCPDDIIKLEFAIEGSLNNALKVCKFARKDS